MPCHSSAIEAPRTFAVSSDSFGSFRRWWLETGHITSLCPTAEWSDLASKSMSCWLHPCILDAPPADFAFMICDTNQTSGEVIHIYGKHRDCLDPFCFLLYSFLFFLNTYTYIYIYICALGAQVVWAFFAAWICMMHSFSTLGIACRCLDVLTTLLASYLVSDRHGFSHISDYIGI